MTRLAVAVSARRFSKAASTVWGRSLGPDVLSRVCAAWAYFLCRRTGEGYCKRAMIGGGSAAETPPLPFAALGAACQRFTQALFN